MAKGSSAGSKGVVEGVVGGGGCLVDLEICEGRESFLLTNRLVFTSKKLLLDFVHIHCEGGKGPTTSGGF